MQTKSYAFFDFDGTLIKGDSIIRFCFYAHRNKLCSLGHLIYSGIMATLYHLGITNAEKSKQAALSFLAGMPRKEVEKLAKDFCNHELIPNLYPEGVEAIRRHRLEGTEVWMVSASTAFYLEPLKKHLRLTGLIGTRMHVLNGMYTGQMAGENCRGVEKPLRLAEVLASRGDMLDYGESSAYGDSAGDAPMLSLCARKVAVNPRKKLLKELEGVEGVEKVRWR